MFNCEPREGFLLKPLGFKYINVSCCDVRYYYPGKFGEKDSQFCIRGFLEPGKETFGFYDQPFTISRDKCRATVFPGGDLDNRQILFEGRITSDGKRYSGDGKEVDKDGKIIFSGKYEEAQREGDVYPEGKKGLFSKSYKIGKNVKDDINIKGNDFCNARRRPIATKVAGISLEEVIRTKCKKVAFE